MRTAFFVAVVATFAVVTTALAQTADLAAIVGVWKGRLGTDGALTITLTVNSVDPKASGSLETYSSVNVEAVTLRGDKVYVKFAGGDMTLTVSGGKASGHLYYPKHGGHKEVLLTKQ